MGGNQQTAVAKNLGHKTVIDGDHGHAGGECFGNHQRLRFVDIQGGEKQIIQSPEKIRLGLTAQHAMADKIGTEFRLGLIKQGTVRCLHRHTRQCQFGCDPMGQKRTKGIDRPADPLLRRKGAQKS